MVTVTNYEGHDATSSDVGKSSFRFLDNDLLFVVYCHPFENQKKWEGALVVAVLLHDNSTRGHNRMIGPILERLPFGERCFLSVWTRVATLRARETWLGPTSERL